jgi:hypothetical protein
MPSVPALVTAPLTSISDSSFPSWALAPVLSGNMQETCEKLIEDLVATTKQATADIEKFTEQRTQLESSLKETEASLKQILSTAVVAKPRGAEDEDE